ncbi:MAG: hypothetical protein US51_C0054G0001 [Microgenomates group bacterium GW2011_GWA2_37_6]|nr:MAG: hypothetical protein US51_C0054G0001 [Microgenomates group bacterium GW2011_GWA2_37_6]
MSIDRFEGSGRIFTEHILSRDQLYDQMKVIEDLVDARFRIRGMPMALLVIDKARNVTLKYEEFPGPARPPRKIGNIHATDGNVRIRSEQVMHLRGNRIGFDPLLVFDDPSLGEDYENSQEAANAIVTRLTRILSNPQRIR